LVEAVEAGLADRARRPDAAAFAGLLRRAHAAAPVRLSGGAPAAGPVPEVRPTHVVRAAAHAAPPARRGRPSASVLVAAGGVLLLALAAVGGWQLGRAGGAEAAALPPVVSAAPAPDWAGVLDGLDGARAEAFADGDLSALQEVYATGSPGLVSDAALLQDLIARGQTAHGLRHDVRTVELLASTADSARLRVVDVLGSYEIRSAAGDLVERAPARGERSFVVELVRAPDGWRLVEVAPEA
jgi:hypothetical protein